MFKAGYFGLLPNKEQDSQEHEENNDGKATKDILNTFIIVMLMITVHEKNTLCGI